MTDASGTTIRLIESTRSRITLEIGMTRLRFGGEWNAAQGTRRSRFVLAAEDVFVGGERVRGAERERAMALFAEFTEQQGWDYEIDAAPI